VPEKIAIDQSGATRAIIESYVTEEWTGIVIGQAKYLNNMIEQDHRAIKRITRPMPGFKCRDSNGSGANSSRIVLLLGCITPLKGGIVLLMFQNCDITVPLPRS